MRTGEVEDGGVLGDVRWVRRAREHDEALLQRPANEHLGRRPPDLVRDGPERAIRKSSVQEWIQHPAGGLSNAD
jgi:hypothetical protein